MFGSIDVSLLELVVPFLNSHVSAITIWQLPLIGHRWTPGGVTALGLVPPRAIAGGLRS